MNRVIVFVHIPKTAGTSLSFILHNTFMLSHCHTDHTKKQVITRKEFRIAKRIFYRLKSMHGHGLINATEYLPENSVFYTFLRDPIVRMASEYQADVIQGGQTKSFEDWVTDKSRYNAHVKMIAGSEDLERAKSLLAEKYTFVGLTEKFRESLHALTYYLPYKLDINHVKRKNVASNNDIKNTILSNPKYVEMLKQANNLDIELYKFAKEKLYPQFIEKIPENFENNSKSHRVPRLRYRISIVYNKLIYRQLYKIINKFE